MNKGFTLIEMSIVLVIIGLIIGAILVGQDLIHAAAARAQIGQIEKYNQAVNTFKGKYGYLPGDMNAAAAKQFGFLARPADCSGTACPGEGDGNGVLQAWTGGTDYRSDQPGWGEPMVFWMDLSTANLIDDSFPDSNPPWSSSPWYYANWMAWLTSDAPYFPAAKIGGGAYVYVWSGGYANYEVPPSYSTVVGDGINYFGISLESTLVGLGFDTNYAFGSTPALTVSQAYSIDSKMDDGLPQSGKVIAMVINTNCNLNSINNCWAAGPGHVGAGTRGNGAAQPPTNAATPYETYNCYDNNNQANTVQTYSMSKNAAMVNCGLSFQFQ